MVSGEAEAECPRASLLGRYEIGRTLGEGNFGKVKYARHRATGAHFAVKILDRNKILSQRIDDQIRREIGTLKLLKHPNVVRLHEVAASKTKIYMVLEFVNGGELFDKIAIRGKLSEQEGRRLFQQLIDGVSYCHDKGVYHRDLKPENVLVDRRGNIKISDFGLSALPQHLGNDGLLHTTCGSPNYIAPEVLQNRGYDGSLSDIWSCGVILYVMLVGYLPFDDRNLVVLYQKIFKGDCQIPKWLSPSAQDLIRKILDPNPMKRINISGIKEHEWFRKDYVPAIPYDDDEDIFSGSILPIKEQTEEPPRAKPTHINAFQLIGMASSLDLSGFFEEEVRSYMPSRVKQILPSFCKDMFCILDSLSFNSAPEDGAIVRLKIAKRCLIICCTLVTRHRKHADDQMPHIVKYAIKISKQSIKLCKLDSLPDRICSLAFDVISRVLETGPGWRLVSPHFSSLLDSSIFPALTLNEKDRAEWEEDTDEYMQKNLPSELDGISGWTEDLFTARKSAINLLGVLALSKGPPVASAASKRKKGDKSKGKSQSSSIGELLVIPFLSKFPIPSHGEDALSITVQNYFGILMAYGGLQDFLTEKKELTVTLITNRILPLYSLDPCSPYLISTANWVIGQLASCLPEVMSVNIYHCLMKALAMEDVEDITCYPVCASASGAIAELIECGYAPPDRLVLLHAVVNRISTGDENKSALLFKLLGTIVEGGQEEVLPHIPEIVSSIANTIMKLLPPAPDPWPQVVEQGFGALVSMAQAWESSAPDENKKHEKNLWQSGQSAISQTFSRLLQKAWLLPIEGMGMKFSSALPPPSCVNDASVLLEFIMRSVTCVETASMKVFELVAVWADTIAYWDSWEEMEDQGVFNTVKEAINFHNRFDFTGFFLKMLPSQSENDSQSSVIGRVSNFVARAIAAYPSATWRACSCIHTLLHAPNFSVGTEDARKALAASFAQAAFSRFKSVSDSPAGIWKPLVLAISSCYICYPDTIEQVLCNYDSNGYAIWTSALSQVSSTSFSPGLSSASEIKLAVLTLATVTERLLALSMGGTKLLQDCYVSLLESCIHLKEVEEDGDSDDDDGAEDLDDDDEDDDDTEDDDEDSDDDDVREETEEEFLERYALAAAAGEAIEVVEEGDIDEETQDIELGSLDEVDIQQVVLSLIQKRPALQTQTLPDTLNERIIGTFPEYGHLFHRQA